MAVPFWIVGVLAGLAIWWFLVGPKYAGTDNPILVLAALPVFAFGGMYVGNLVGLVFARRR